MSDGAAGGPSSARLHTLSRSDRSSPGRGGSTDATQTEGASPSTAQLPPTFPPQQEVKPPSLQGGHGRWWSRSLQLHLFGKRRRDPRSTAQVIRAKRREIEVLQQPAPDEQGSDAQLSPVGVCSCADGWSGKRTRNALGHGRIHGTRSRGPAFQQSGRKPGKPARRTTLGNLG